MHIRFDNIKCLESWLMSILSTCFSDISFLF